MARLATQHQPGGWKTKSDPYEVQCAWPEDCLVQWGSKGIVFDRKKGTDYMTAFFEAFPGTFIRGEGATLAEAEHHAYKQHLHFQACPGHEYEKRGYTNGAGFCKHCGHFSSKVFPPWEKCSLCEKLTYSKYEGRFLCEDHYPSVEELFAKRSRASSRGCTGKLQKPNNDLSVQLPFRRTQQSAREGSSPRSHRAVPRKKDRVTLD